MKINYSELNNESLIKELSNLALSNNKLSFVLTKMMENKKIFDLYVKEVLPNLPEEVLK